MDKDQRNLRRGHEALELEIALGETDGPRLTYAGPPGETGAQRGGPRSRLIRTAPGGRGRHRSHRPARDGDGNWDCNWDWDTLSVHLHDPETGLVAAVNYRSPDGVPVLRSDVTLRNEGQTTLHPESVSSLAVGRLTPQAPTTLDAAELLWRRPSLRPGRQPDRSRPAHPRHHLTHRLAPPGHRDNRDSPPAAAARLPSAPPTAVFRTTRTEPDAS